MNYFHLQRLRPRTVDAVSSHALVAMLALAIAFVVYLLAAASQRLSLGELLTFEGRQWFSYEWESKSECWLGLSEGCLGKIKDRLLTIHR